jgi:TRAP-type uncharacterized transport system substrate-binding protein
VQEPHIRRRRTGGWLALLLGIAALGAALVFFLETRSAPARQITLSPGEAVTTRALIARELAAEVTRRGIEARVVEAQGTRDELEQVNAGTLDFALVSGAYRIGRFEHVRELRPSIWRRSTCS